MKLTLVRHLWGVDHTHGLERFPALKLTRRGPRGHLRLAGAPPGGSFRSGMPATHGSNSTKPDGGKARS